MIRMAGARDLEAVMALYATAPPGTLCPAPTRSDVERAITAGASFVAVRGGAVCGGMVLDRTQPREYGAVPWRWPAAPDQVLVVHALCVAPAYRRTGCATELLGFARARARALGCTAVRLDTWGDDAAACALYGKAGLSCAGRVPVLLDGRALEQVFFEQEADGESRTPLIRPDALLTT